MQKIDIRKIKKEIRDGAKEYRASLNISEKTNLDTKIKENLFELDCIKEADTVLCYMSTNIEIDTKGIISELLSKEKKVALPRCIDGTREMNFYLVEDLSQTEKHSFGVYEPNPQKCEKLRDFRKSVCILPGLCFDSEGYRLGYGKGYYDRFLSKYRSIKIGLCYEECFKDKLPHGFYDVPCNIIITENRKINIEE